jgi:hypothetical protein
MQITLNRTTSGVLTIICDGYGGNDTYQAIRKRYPIITDESGDGLLDFTNDWDTDGGKADEDTIKFTCDRRSHTFTWPAIDPVDDPLSTIQPTRTP